MNKEKFNKILPYCGHRLKARLHMKVKYYKCKYCGRIFKSESAPHTPHNCKPGFRKRHLDFKEIKILHLVLKGKWYDMIESGEKKEEYREIKTYWKKRLCSCYNQCCADEYCAQCNDIPWRQDFKPFDAVSFSRGYTSQTMLFQLEEITIGKGNLNWGAPDYETFILKLGEKLR